MVLMESSSLNGHGGDVRDDWGDAAVSDACGVVLGRHIVRFEST